MLRFAAALPADHFHVVLEVTERAMIDKEKSMANFAWLHRQGFEIAIDDFGTGHSALIYLERYNFDYLKIDRGFVQAIGTETVTSPVLDAVLTLSRRLKLMTVAEGVETQEQAEWLRGQAFISCRGTGSADRCRWPGWWLRTMNPRTISQRAKSHL